MKRKLLFLLSLVVLLAATGSAKKVHTLGDSTMAPYDEKATVTRGWGMYFGQFLTNGWTSINYAKGGRRTSRLATMLSLRSAITTRRLTVWIATRCINTTSVKG